MVPITVEVLDELAARLRPLSDRLPEILERGLREMNASSQPGFAGAAEVLEFLAGLPAPEEILNLRPSPALKARVDELLDRSRAGALEPAEAVEWEQYAFLEHLVRLAKARALLRLKSV
jgi:hypothetical protein